MADRVWKELKPKVIVPSDELSLNKFFDSINLSMRTSKIENGCQGAPKWPLGSGKRHIPRFWGAPANFL